MQPRRPDLGTVHGGWGPRAHQRDLRGYSKQWEGVGRPIRTEGRPLVQGGGDRSGCGEH